METTIRPDNLKVERTGSMFHRILANDGRPIFCTVGGGHDSPYTAEEIDANARRLAACWNACVGVPTEDLENYYNAGGGIDEALDEVSLRAHVAAVKERDTMSSLLGQIGDIVGAEDGERSTQMIVVKTQRLRGRFCTMVRAAQRLAQRGFFSPTSCASVDAQADMSAMREALSDAEVMP